MDPTNKTHIKSTVHINNTKRSEAKRLHFEVASETKCVNVRRNAKTKGAQHFRS
jgi:hypothetical protein